MGLFYKVDEPDDLFELVYSVFSNAIKDDTGHSYTPIQASAYKHIHNRRYFSFSAPTSTGKSHLFKDLIRDTKEDIVIMVPSRALIAEYISAILEIVDKDVLVLQFVENINIEKTKRRIFVITPERGNELFKYIKEFNIKLFLLDEAQISEEKIRGIRFDVFVRRVTQSVPEATIVFAHPFINNPECQLKKHGLDINSSSKVYSQNATGKIYVFNNENKFFYFSPYTSIEEYIPVKKRIVEEILLSSGTVLIYASKNKIYNGNYLSEYGRYIKYCTQINDPIALSQIEKLREYIGAGKDGSKKESVLIRLMKRGIVIHHGSMPLKARLIIEDFIRHNFAKVCFSTSTLIQGINMPFDAVIIDNFYRLDSLSLKNLIGRAGRTTTSKEFEIGYVIIPFKNINTFKQRIKEKVFLTETSKFDIDLLDMTEEQKDLVEAIQNNTFNNDLRLTESQLNRLKSEDVYIDIKFILDNLIKDDKAITGNEYYELVDASRNKIKNSMKNIFIKHLRRKSLTKAESAILSTSIPILLWHIQGKSFKEVLALRYYFLTQQKEQRKIERLVKLDKKSREEADSELAELKIRFSQVPTSIPDIYAKSADAFDRVPVNKLDYDLLVYDTYDYLDKVISLSLADPLCAAFQLYYEKSKDERAKIISNYIRYGTNNEKEIWLLKYGFSFEDIEWLKLYVERIDQKQITFKNDVFNLSAEKLDVIERYL